MVTVLIHKDILAYEPKVAFILTQRTLVFSGVAVAAAIAIGWVCMGVIGLDTDVAIYPIMLVCLPIFFLGYCRPLKMKPEDLAPFWLRGTFLPQQLTYVSTPNLTRRLPVSQVDARTRNERYDSAPLEVQRHYAKLKRTRGIEGYDSRECLDGR